MNSITAENINWGDWGTYSFKRFMADFSTSEELNVVTNIYKKVR